MHLAGVPAVGGAHLELHLRGEVPIDHPYANPLTLPAASWQRLGCSCLLVTVSGASGQDRLNPWQRAYYATLRGSGWPGEAQL